MVRPLGRHGPPRPGKALSFSRLVGGWTSGDFPFPLASLSCYFLLHPRLSSEGGWLHPLGSPGEASPGHSPPAGCLPPWGTQRAVGCSSLAHPPHSGPPQAAPPCSAGPGGFPLQTWPFPSINSLLHCCGCLPHSISSCLGRAVPSSHLHSRKGPSSSSWLWGIQAVGVFPLFRRQYRPQRTFSLAQSTEVWYGSHWGRGGGKRPLRPRGTLSSAGSGLLPALRGPDVERDLRAFSNSLARPGCAVCSLSLPQGWDCPVPVSDLDCGFPATPPAVPAHWHCLHSLWSLRRERPFPGSSCRRPRWA